MDEAFKKKLRGVGNHSHAKLHHHKSHLVKGKRHSFRRYHKENKMLTYIALVGFSFLAIFALILFSYFAPAVSGVSVEDFRVDTTNNLAHVKVKISRDLTENDSAVSLYFLDVEGNSYEYPLSRDKRGVVDFTIPASSLGILDLNQIVHVFAGLSSGDSKEGEVTILYSNETNDLKVEPEKKKKVGGGGGGSSGGGSGSSGSGSSGGNDNVPPVVPVKMVCGVNLPIDGPECSDIDFDLSVATIKDVYWTFEDIRLTDPPEPVQAGREESFDFGDFESLSNSLETENYLVEFEGDPLILKYVDLLESDTEPFLGGLFGIFSDSDVDVQEELEEYSQELEVERNDVKAEIFRELGSESIFSTKSGKGMGREFLNVFNGVSMSLTEEQVEIVRGIKGVKGVYPDLIVETQMMDSVPYLGVDEVWNLDREGNDCRLSGKPCLTGKGIRVGVIDTGIDYTHPSLGGCTREEFLTGICEKVAGGYDFIEDDFDPIDDQGHGSHCAGTIAGNTEGFKGVAPDATLYAYKVLDSTGSGPFTGIMAAVEKSVDPNGDGDFSDKLDVISLSLGGRCFGGYTTECGPEDVSSRTIDNVVRAGVVAVIAAGNSGPREKTIGSPGTSRNAITVGASYNGDNMGTYSEMRLASDNRELSTRPISIVTPGQDFIEFGVVTIEDLENYEFTESLEGKAVLTGSRQIYPSGKPKRYDLVNKLIEQGAEALLFNVSSHSDKIDEALRLPTVNVLKTDANYLQNSLGDGLVKLKITHDDETIAYFSSRGPVLSVTGDSIIKPDILAPGVSICSSQFDDAWNESSCGDGYTSILGTSMATPHVSGLVALMLQKDPSLNPFEIKQKLMMSADLFDLNKYGPNDQGSGLVNITRALDLEPTNLAFFSEDGGVFTPGVLEIRGSAFGEDFVGYNVSYKLNLSEDAIEICRSEVAVQDDVLCVWDSSDLDNGVYYVILDTEFSGDTIRQVLVYELQRAKIYEPSFYPDFHNVFPLDEDSLDLMGVVGGSGFTHYSIDLVDPLGEGVEGAVIIEDPTSELVLDVLGKVDFSKLEITGDYIVKLTSHYESGESSEDEISFYYSSDLADGWPVEVKGDLEGVTSGLGAYSTGYKFGIGDIDNDGLDDLVILQNKNVHVINSEGEVIDGWPAVIDTRSFTPVSDVEKSNAVFMQEPVVADLDHDGNREIIAMDWSNYLHVFNNRGEYVFPAKFLGRDLDSATIAVEDRILVDDLDNNGFNDIIVLVDGKDVHVLNHSGEDMPGWPVKLDELLGTDSTGGSGISVGDSNQNGYKELFLKINEFTYNPKYLPDKKVVMRVNHSFFALDYKGEFVEGNWPIKKYNAGKNTAIADLNNDGNLEFFRIDPTWDKITIWDYAGNVLSEFETFEMKTQASSAIVSDLNNDGLPEIVFLGTHKPEGGSYNDINEVVYAYDFNGEAPEGYPYHILNDNFTSSVLNVDFLVSNLDDDVEPEILFPGVNRTRGAWTLYSFNDDFSVNFEKSLGTYTWIPLMPLIGDLDGDGLNEIVNPSMDFRDFSYYANVHKTLGDVAVSNFWPMVDHNPHRTRNYNFEFHPQSKIVNNGDYAVLGNVTFFLQNLSEGGVYSEELILKKEVIVPANGVLKLDHIWNPLEVSVNYEGDYRVYVEFEALGQKYNVSWDFDVLYNYLYCPQGGCPIPCDDESDCSLEEPLCDLGFCAQCVYNSDCLEETPYCAEGKCSAQRPELDLDDEEYYSKVYGSWLGQIAGNFLGGPTEGKYNSNPMSVSEVYYTNGTFGEGEETYEFTSWYKPGDIIGVCRPDDFDSCEVLSNTDDDTSIEWMDLAILENAQEPLKPTNDEIKSMWELHMRNGVYFANYYASGLMLGSEVPSDGGAPNVDCLKSNFYGCVGNGRVCPEGGCVPPMSGAEGFNPYHDYIDAQIEIEVFGLIAPGMVDVAEEYADQFARVTNDGFAVDYAKFYAMAYSHAFSEDNVSRIINFVRAEFPAESRVHEVVGNVTEWYLENPDDWRATRQKIYQKYYSEEKNLYGRGRGAWFIHSTMNFASTIMALLYSQDEDVSVQFDRGIQIATLAGFDNDCNAPTTAGLLGILAGHDGIPEKWKAPIRDEYYNDGRGTLDFYPDEPYADKITNIARRTFNLGETLIQENDLQGYKKVVKIPLEEVLLPEPENLFVGNVVLDNFDLAGFF